MHPILFRFGQVAISTYGVLAACGLILGLMLSLRTARLAGLPPDSVWDAGLFCILAAFTLSRILLVADHFSSFLAHPFLLLTLPSLTAKAIAGTALLTVAWLVRHRLPILAMADVWTPSAVLILGFLGLGHFAGGSDPGLHGNSIGLHEAIVAFGLSGLLFLSLRHGKAGQTTGAGLIAVGIAEFALGFLRAPDTSGATSLLDPMQWTAVAATLVGFLCLAFRPRSAPNLHVSRQGERTAGAEAGFAQESRN